MDATAAQKIDYAVTENTEILLDLGPVDSVGYKISDREDNIVLTSNHAQESQPKTIYACHVCDKIFNDNDEMLEHLSAEHATKYTQIQPNKSPPELDDSKLEHDYHRKAACTVTSGQISRDLGQDISSKPYKCAHCGERFKRGSEVGVHMFKHSNTFQHFCDFCGMIFVRQSDVDEHISLFHSSQKENLMSQHRCGHCGVSFSHRNSLYKHIKCHKDTLSSPNESKGSQDCSGLVILTDVQSVREKKKTSGTSRLRNFKKYSCKFCYSEFQTKESLTKHISSHPEWNPAICEVCGEYFAIEVDLKEHKKIHKRKYVPCKICSRVFMSHKRLEKHMDTHSASENKPTQLKTIKVSPPKNKQIPSNKKSKTAINHVSSKNKTRIKEKKLTITPRENKKHLNKCKSSTKSNSSVPCNIEKVNYETMKEVPIEVSDYKCDVCAKSFPLLKLLTAHMNKWHCATRQKFECEYCNSSFCQRMTYFNHLLKHFKKSNYACRHCSLDFKNARQLKEHIHTSKRHKQTYSCSLCSKVFDDQLSQKRHRELAHPWAAIFKCNICSRQFASVKQMRNHMNLHTVKKQYECDICAQTFSRLSLLFQHLVTHAQKIMYKCQYCPRLFPSQISLQKHISIHTHLRSTSVCIVCQKTFQKPENLSKHLETHLHKGDQPFTCCKKTFTNVQQICNHLKLKSHAH